MVAISGTLSNWMYNNRAYSVVGSLPFELGKTYKRRDGKEVKIIKVSGECVQGDDGDYPESGYRYNRTDDRGRCTGTAGDFSDPKNLLPDFLPDVKNAGEGFFVPVSLMGQNKTPEQRAWFSELLTLENKIYEIKCAALHDNDWKGAHDKIFQDGLSKRVGELVGNLGLSLVYRADGNDYKDRVWDFEWNLMVLTSDHRDFYVV